MDICICSFMLSMFLVVTFLARDTGKCLKLNIDSENIEDMFSSSQNQFTLLDV